MTGGGELPADSQASKAPHTPALTEPESIAALERLLTSSQASSSSATMKMQPGLVHPVHA
jgi:hypothetical protein